MINIDDMALPAGKSCADCVGFARCRAFIGAAHIHDKQHRCDWSPSAFRQRNTAPKPAEMRIAPGQTLETS